MKQKLRKIFKVLLPIERGESNSMNGITKIEQILTKKFKKK